MGVIGPIRVLHVDDDPAFLDLVGTVLEREDDRIEVATAASAAGGIDALDGAVDCIVSDYDMPGETGIDFLERVRERDPDLPFILFTGKGSEEVASDAISAGVTDYVRKSPESEQYEILINRIVNAVEAARVRERAARQEHINTLIREINRRLVAADGVDEVEAAVCRALADSTPYRFAWIGEPDAESGEILPRTSAGAADAYLDEVTIYYDDRSRGQGPGGRAIRTGELQVAANIPDDPSFEPWHDAAERYGYESVAVVPLSYRGDRDGILAVYADHPHAFDDEELRVLEELGETVGRALNAAETRRRLEARRAAETARRERHYRMLVDSLPNGAVALFDTDLTYTVVGGAVFDDLGISPAEMEGTALSAVHSASFREEYLHNYRAALDGEERSFAFEYEGRIFEARVAPVRDEAGAVGGGIAVTQDVTERTRRQRELTRRERVLRETYEVVADPSLSVTEGIRRLLGVGANALGVRYGLLARVDGDECEYEMVRTADGTEPDDEGPTEGETVPLSITRYEQVVRAGERVVATDGSEGDRPHYVGAPVVVGGETYGALCFADLESGEDFSGWELTLVDLLCRWVESALDRRETTARLRAQNERFREFTSIVSHDLRNPFGVLSGALELAEATGETEQFDRCRRALDRMRALIDDLTTLTQEGATVDDVEPLPLGLTARACWDTVETGTAELAVDRGATIRADEGRLRQLLENLFRNAVVHGPASDRTGSGDAVKHGSAGSRSGADGAAEHDANGTGLTIRVGRLDEGDGFYVADDGVGIPEERRAEVFERGHSSTTGGTGLGLSIVEKMAEAHGWTVGVTESAAGGARIEVRNVVVVEDGSD